MGESRVELLAWVNALLQLNYTKIEQLGTGAAFCQIFDSIWGNLQMHKVKFDAKHEYEYVQNYKVLQIAFEKNNVDKVIPVEKLIKCKFQDNITFCQWAKRFHDMYYPGGHYDAPARRKVASSKASKMSSTSTLAKARRSSQGGGSSHSVRSVSRPSSTAPPFYAPSMDSPAPPPSMAPGTVPRRMAELARQVDEQGSTIEALEKERDFYFTKLRDIEILVQQEAARGDAPADLIALIQQILYATDQEGFFQLPDDDAPAGSGGGRLPSSGAGGAAMQVDSDGPRHDAPAPARMDDDLSDPELETF